MDNKTNEVGKSMKKAIKITLWSLGSILTLIVLLFAVALFLLTPKRLTPIVNSYATEYLNATVNFQRVEVSLFEHFPQVSLKLVGAEVISHALSGSDTLLRFDRFAVSIDAWKLISGKVSIRSVELDKPWISAVVDSVGKASWDIVKSSSSDSSSSELELNIESMVINGEATIGLHDVRDSTSIHLCLDQLAAKGHLSNDVKLFSLQSMELEGLHGSISSRHDTINGSFMLDTMRVIRDGQIYRTTASMAGGDLRVGSDSMMRRVAVRIAGGIGYTDSVATLDKLTVDIGGIRSVIDGTVKIGDSTINSTLRVTSPHIGIKNLLALVPSIDKKTIAKIRSDISLGVDLSVNGSYNTRSGALPDIKLTVSSPDGYLYMDGVSEKLDKFALSSTIEIAGGKSSLKVDKLHIVGAGISLLASGEAVNIMSVDAHIDANVNGRISVDSLMAVLPESAHKDFSARGSIEISAGGCFALSELNIKSLAKTTLWAKLTLHDFDLQIPTADVKMHASGLLTLGTGVNERDTIIAIGARVVGVHATLDTLLLSVGDDISVNGRKIDAFASTTVARYADVRKKIHPFNGTVSATRFSIMAADSSLLRLKGISCNFNVTPSPTNDTVPLLRSTITAKSVSARSDLDRYVLQGMRFEVQANVIEKKRTPAGRRQRRTQLTADEMSAGDLDMKVGGEFLQILRRWNAEGTLHATRMRVITPYLPLRTEIRNLDLTFNTDKIDLNSLGIHVGQSRINVNGHISNLKRVLAGRGVLKIDIDVKGDTLNLSELISAVNSGTASIDQIRSRIDSLGSGNEDQVAEIIAQSSSEVTENSLIIIPKNIDLNIALNVDNALYGDMIMDSLAVELISRNRVLHIKGLTARSNLGQMNLNAIYSTRSKTDISTGFDIELRGVKVAELIEMLPSVDSMLPMLASFEGEVDCKLAAGASIDTAMNIVIPTLDAAGSIKGRNLVLLDGQTFTEISKIMRFKNRKRNIVDSISVQMLVRNSEIEIFPFILEIDRYKTAVSGVQKLDMSFEYHISVLKSVVPFRLGVNIFGDLDKWDFKLVKAKYKSENLPSYVQLIDTTRINLRKQIADIFKN